MACKTCDRIKSLKSLDELENIQTKSLAIPDLSPNFLPALEERRNKRTSRDFNRIKDDINHSFKANLASIQFKFQELHPPIVSVTERHKLYFIPRATYTGRKITFTYIVKVMQMRSKFNLFTSFHIFSILQIYRFTPRLQWV